MDVSYLKCVSLYLSHFLRWVSSLVMCLPAYFLNQLLPKQPC